MAESASDEMEILCGVYGEASVFPVMIARNAKVVHLQKAIVEENTKYADQRFNIDPSLLTLYLAKKTSESGEGVWLSGGRKLKTLLQGAVDTTYEEMLPAWGLDDEAYFGPNFQPRAEEIHILVKLPEAVHAAPTLRPRLIVGMNSDSEYRIASYKQVAESLKNTHTVSQLVHALHYVTKESSTVPTTTDPTATDDRPFIVLKSSSGMGKTQMAFNLMARDDIYVHYIVCNTQQKIYKAFASRSESFLRCIERDLRPDHLPSTRDAYPLLTDGQYQAEPAGLALHTFTFVRALLRGENTMEDGACSFEEVQSLIQDLKRLEKLQVVFIDEFPLLDREHKDSVKLQFMRNVFRSLKLPVILSSTNGTARNMITTGNQYSRGLDQERWCVVVPQMAPFHNPSRTSRLKRGMKMLIRRSRPLFANFALDFITDNNLHSQLGDDQHAVSVVDELTRGLATQAWTWKKASYGLASFEWFCVGQVCLFLSAHYYRSIREGLIQGHYARLQDRKMFELRFDKGQVLHKWKLKKSGVDLVGERPQKPKGWVARTIFPPIEEDVLLYLSLLGGKGHRAFEDARGEYVPFYAAFQEADKLMQNPVNCSNPEQPSKDGMHLEAVAVGAIGQPLEWIRWHSTGCVSGGDGLRSWVGTSNRRRRMVLGHPRYVALARDAVSRATEWEVANRTTHRTQSGQHHTDQERRSHRLSSGRRLVHW